MALMRSRDCFQSQYGTGNRLLIYGCALSEAAAGTLFFGGAQFSRELARLYEYSYWAQFLL